MNIDVHNTGLPVAVLYGLGLHSQSSNQPTQASTQQHPNNKPRLEDDTAISNLKPVEAGGATRENQGLRAQSAYSQQEQQIVEQMKARDREVRAHEAAHKNAAGSLAQGGAQFSYDLGPDGNRYAVGGEVSIDTSSVPNNPQATIVKAQIIYSAAMAPAQPSSQDRSVAAAAIKMEADARKELAQENINQQRPANISTVNDNIANDQSERISADDSNQQGLNPANVTASSQNNVQNVSAIEQVVSSLAPAPIGEQLDATI